MSRLVRLVAVAALAVVALSAEIPEEESVLVLSDSNFEEAIAANEYLLVEFYAPWCGHCKKLAPEYAKAAATLKKSKLNIAKMDATANTETPGKFDVSGFPTLKFFVNGVAQDYTGGRTESEIVNWVNKKAGPAAKTIANAEAAEEFKNSAEVVVIGVFPSETSYQAKAFLRLASSIEDVPFGIATSADVATALDIKSPGVILFKAFDEGKALFSGNYNDEELKTFVTGNFLPLVVPFTQANTGKIFGGPLKTHLLVFAEEGTNGYKELLADVKEVAQEVKGKLLVVSVGKGNDRVTEYFGIKKADQPTAAIINMPEGGSMKKFNLGHSQVNKAVLSTFVSDYLEGKLTPTLKSAEPPADNSAPVKVVVGKTFEQIALDNTKDVLLEFYAPWCGHCKSLAPIYDELAEKFSSVKSIVIAKMDATANEVDYPGVDVKGFPTLKFFPAGEGKKKVVDYDGARDLEGLSAFLKASAAIPFTLEEQENDEL